MPMECTVVLLPKGGYIEQYNKAALTREGAALEAT